MTQLQPGTELIGRYTIRQQIGGGGFGTVYRATDLLDERDVAVKSLALDALPAVNHAQVQANFQREAKLLYTLSHPVLPRVSNYFLEGGQAYLVMDYIAGQNLAEVLDSQPDQPLDEADAVGVILPVLDALVYLHSRTPPIIHRDIKPGNIIRTPQGEVYLVDFGLAKLDQGVRHTVATAGFASAGFSSPEQYRRQVDPRADLYSVGATLYTLLTGQAPTSATERTASIGMGDPEPLLPIQQVNPAISDSRAAVVMRLLALRPDDRYPSAAAVQQALRGERKVAVATEPMPPPAAEEAQRREVEAARQRAAEEAQRREVEAAQQRTAEAARQRAAEEAQRREVEAAQQRAAEAAQQRAAEVAAQQRAAEQAKLRLVIKIASSIPMEFVEVPAGTFLMGSPDNDPDADDDEKPQHKLYLDTFAICKTPVTNAQFRPFVAGDGYTNPDYWTADGWTWRTRRNRTTPSYWNSSTWNSNAQPVVGLTWYEAMAYVAWLRAQTGGDYRLPSEAEWEKAACGTDERRYPWGDEPPDRERANFAQWVGGTTPVGSFPAGASPYGVLDMSGNVWEWTRSEYMSYPYAFNAEREISLNASQKRFSLRGGGWFSSSVQMKCCARLGNHPIFGYVNSSCGFRVVYANGGTNHT